MEPKAVVPLKSCPRTVPMKILLLGLSRTGTCALREALLSLGYRGVYHGYYAAFDRPTDCKVWLDGLQAKYDGEGNPFGRAEFDQLLGHCEVVSDFPAVSFAPELIQVYPEAKVILTNRDVDDWYESISELLISSTYTYRAAIVDFLARITRSERRWTRPMFRKVWESFFFGDFRRNGKYIYTQHYDQIRAMVPKENLLDYNVKQGWGPLCQFLDHPVPQRPFPFNNDRAETSARITALVQCEALKAVSRLLSVFALVLALVVISGPGIQHFTRILGGAGGE